MVRKIGIASMLLAGFASNAIFEEIGTFETRSEGTREETQQEILARRAQMSPRGRRTAPAHGSTQQAPQPRQLSSEEIHTAITSILSEKVIQEPLKKLFSQNEGANQKNALELVNKIEDIATASALLEKLQNLPVSENVSSENISFVQAITYLERCLQVKLTALTIDDELRKLQEASFADTEQLNTVEQYARELQKLQTPDLALITKQVIKVEELEKRIAETQETIINKLDVQYKALEEPRYTAEEKAEEKVILSRQELLTKAINTLGARQFTEEDNPILKRLMAWNEKTPFATQVSELSLDLLDSVELSILSEEKWGKKYDELAQSKVPNPIASIINLNYVTIREHISNRFNVPQDTATALINALKRARGAVSTPQTQASDIIKSYPDGIPANAPLEIQALYIAAQLEQLPDEADRAQSITELQQILKAVPATEKAESVLKDAQAILTPKEGTRPPSPTQSATALDEVAASLHDISTLLAQPSPLPQWEAGQRAQQTKSLADEGFNKDKSNEILNDVALLFQESPVISQEEKLIGVGAQLAHVVAETATTPAQVQHASETTDSLTQKTILLETAADIATHISPEVVGAATSPPTLEATREALITAQLELNDAQIAAVRQQVPATDAPRQAVLESLQELTTKLKSITLAHLTGIKWLAAKLVYEILDLISLTPFKSKTKAGLGFTLQNIRENLLPNRVARNELGSEISTTLTSLKNFESQLSALTNRRIDALLTILTEEKKS